MAHAAQVTDHLLDILKTINAKHILDVGCGAGGLSRLLTGQGYKVCGIDPQEDHILKARTGSPESEFIISGAEDIPKEAALYDAVVVVNAFHHVPAHVMSQALGECHRVLKPAGELIIIEPLAEGSFFETMRPLEDETEIRNHAKKIIAGASESPEWHLHACIELERTSTFKNVDEFINMVIGVDPARTRAVEEHKQEVTTLFNQNTKSAGDHFILVQPHIIWRLKPLSLGGS